MNRKNNDLIRRKFSGARLRQASAIAAAFITVVILAVAAKFPGLFGQFAKNTIVKAQLVVILLFVNFTFWNWKCPSCGRYLGHDINTPVCRKCGARLQ